MSVNVSENIVVADKLIKRYGNKSVVKGLSFDIKKGEIFGILGPNGAGKTTTLEMIEGVLPIDGGEAFVNGINVRHKPRDIRFIIGVQPQTPSFQDKTKVKEVLELFGSSYGRRVKPEKLLKAVSLEDKANSNTEQLSGGQLQRLSIAAALVHHPKVLFMDEPTTGLDPQARRNVWKLVQAIQKKGITVVLTTHYMEEAERLCDRVAVMDNGKIIAIDSPTNLVEQLLKRGFHKKRQVAEANLEDVFIDLTGKELRD
jgi:ABC-2 type transport system ATP-binding protein